MYKFFILIYNQVTRFGTGYPEKRNDTIPIKTALKDNARIKYIKSHLSAISEAMK